MGTKLTPFTGVSESGTEAAGATGVAVGVTSLPQLRFAATRSFLYAIKDDATGALLFLGATGSPI